MTTEQPTFQDRHGNTWTITLDPVLLTEVKDHCGIRLADLKADPFLRLSNDIGLLIEVVWILCEEAAKTLEMSYLQFAKGITGEQLDGIITALEVAVINFCPTSGRSTRKSLLEEIRLTQVRATEMAMEDLTKNREKNAKTMANSAGKMISKSLDLSEEQLSEAIKSATSSTGLTQ